MKLKKTVVLVGMMGCGKTAVGRAVAAKLGIDLLDSDQEIVEAATMSIAEIFERDGEGFFRDRETEVIRRLLESRVGVLSTGGGAFMSSRNRDIISKFGVSVWLDADLELLWSRVKHKDTRPLLRTPDPKATLAEIFNERVPLYSKADLVVKAKPEYAISDMATAVIEALKTRPDVLE
ncbi:MAG: shikimate kinase [Paracoccaceae bacterium]|nr:shikimate kinase [Paracoccaceae bacterium]